MASSGQAGQIYPWPDDNAVLKILAGTEGPPFLMMKNFYVLKRYNNSDSYALAVGLLADRLAGWNGLVQTLATASRFSQY